MDKGKDIRFVFCDISKAFDRVWDNGLLFKLKYYSAAGNVFSWIEHFLTDRKQKVVVEGFSSSFKSINAGVPQGSVLGFLFLFLLYINDISNGLANSIIFFADDASLYATVECDINNVTSSLNDDLEKTIVWSNKWAIDFNPFKTFNVDFSRKKYNFQNCNSVFRDQNFPSLSHNHLRIHFQLDGHWNKHIQTIKDRAPKRLNLLKMLKYKMNRKSRVII